MKNIYLLLFLILISCNDSTTITESTTFYVSGIIVDENGPVQNVDVNIDKALNWTTKTDASGNFRIEKVSEGNHQLTVSKNHDDKSFVMREEKLVVNSNIELQNMVLPKPIHLNEIENKTATSAELLWNKTDASDFREYKLYRHSSSGLDETTGTLVHVSTSLTDTMYIDTQLNPYENYYYRIYVMNEYGRIGGSNIVQVQTENVQLIRNGSFEELVNGNPSDWILVDNSFGNPNNYILIDNNFPFDGKNSLKFHHAEEGGCWEQWITQRINNSLFVPGGRYKLTMNFRADFIDDISFNLILRNSTIDLWLDVPVSVTNTDEWSEISYEFGLPENIGNNDVDIKIHFCTVGIRTWWIDNVHITRTE